VPQTLKEKGTQASGKGGSREQNAKVLSFKRCAETARKETRKTGPLEWGFGTQENGAAPRKRTFKESDRGEDYGRGPTPPHSTGKRVPLADHKIDAKGNDNDLKEWRPNRRVGEYMGSSCGLWAVAASMILN